MTEFMRLFVFFVLLWGGGGGGGGGAGGSKKLFSGCDGSAVLFPYYGHS